MNEFLESQDTVKLPINEQSDVKVGEHLNPKQDKPLNERYPRRIRVSSRPDAVKREELISGTGKPEQTEQKYSNIKLKAADKTHKKHASAILHTDYQAAVHLQTETSNKPGHRNVNLTKVADQLKMQMKSDGRHQDSRHE